MTNVAVCCAVSRETDLFIVLFSMPTTFFKISIHTAYMKSKEYHTCKVTLVMGMFALSIRVKRYNTMFGFFIRSD